MAFDFSKEDNQKEYGLHGPVPAGSIVVVELTILEPHASRQASDNPYISVANSGLRQLYTQFTVDRGQYMGVDWRQNLTLPAAFQDVALNPKQEMACRIGGSIIKAMLQAAKRPLAINKLTDLNLLKFPVRVKINPRPYESKTGEIFWRNELAQVITPDMAPYAEAQRMGEIIVENGAVKGKEDSQPAEKRNQGYDYAPPPEADYAIDSVPF